VPGLTYTDFDWEIISLNDYKLSYIPIPKAANTSIMNAMFKSLPQEVQKSRLQKVKESNPPVRSDIPAIVHFAKRLMFDSVQRKSNHDREKFVFSCVRHPTSRFLSFYKDKILAWDPFIEKNLRRLGFEKGMDIQDCIHNLLQLEYRQLDQHLIPNTMFLYYKGKNICDLVLKVEYLDQGWEYIKYRTGISTDLEHENNSDIRKVGTVTLDQEYIKKIEDYYWEDMVLLNYESKASKATTISR